MARCKKIKDRAGWRTTAVSFPRGEGCGSDDDVDNYLPWLFSCLRDKKTTSSNRVTAPGLQAPQVQHRHWQGGAKRKVE